ncbi:MAG: Hemolysin-type calcium-binding region, partial [Magnetococcales bacterium]|nr:Hemolysin-type calcium-binding region [Magnetococcales bacterium]
MPSTLTSSPLVDQLATFVEVLSSGNIDAIVAGKKALTDTLLQQGISPDQAETLGAQVLENFVTSLGQGDSTSQAAQGVIRGAENAVETLRANPENPTQSLAAALASGQGLQEQLAATGGKDGQSGAFLAAIQQALQSGQGVESAINTAKLQQQAAQQAADNQAVQVDTPDGLAIGLALGLGQAENALTALVAGMSEEETAVFLKAFQDAISRGMDLRASLALAKQFSDRVLQTSADQHVELSPADRLAAALSDGKNATEALSEAGLQNGGDDNAASLGFVAALAAGDNPTQAAQIVGQIKTMLAQIQNQQVVPLSPADRLAMALSSGGQEAQSALEKMMPADQQGANAFIATLSQTMERGIPPGVALSHAQAAQTSVATVEKNSSLPTTPADQAMVAMATGKNIAALSAELSKSGPSEAAAFMQTFTQMLAQGISQSAAMSQANQVAAATAVLATASTVPISPSQQMVLAMADPSIAISPAFKEQAANGGAQLAQVANAMARPENRIESLAQIASASVFPSASSNVPVSPSTAAEINSSPPVSVPAAETPVAAVRESAPSESPPQQAVSSAPIGNTTPLAGEGVFLTPVEVKPAIQLPQVKQTPPIQTTTEPVVPIPPPPVVPIPINTSPILIVPGAQSSAEDSVLEIKGVQVDDAEAGTLAVALKVDHGKLTLADTTGLTFTQGTGISDAGVAFHGTKSAVNTALSVVSYQGLTTFYGLDHLSLQVSDLGVSGTGGVLAAQGTVDILLRPVNHPPAIVAVEDVHYTENAAAIPLGATITLRDNDDTFLSGATVAITAGLSQGDVLTVAPGSGMTGSYDAATGILYLAGNATLTDYQAALRGVTFYNSGDDPVATFTSRTIAWKVTDANSDGAGGQTSPEVTSIVHITAINDAPTATHLNATESVSEDAAPFSLTDIVVTDPDTGGIITATLTFSSSGAGVLSTATNGSVTSSFDGRVWSASGPLADVNALLAGVTLTPTANWDSSFSIATSVSDGVAPTVTGTKAVTVIAVNDAPTATHLNAAESVSEDAAPFSLTDIVVTDPDTGGTITATLIFSSSGAGVLSTATNGSVTSSFDGRVWSAIGPLANVNALLAGVTLTPTANWDSSFSIATSVSDGVAPTVTGTKAVTVIAVNDAPTVTNLNAAESFTEDGGAFSLIDSVVTDP